AIDRDTFADHVVVADDDLGVAAAVADILWVAAEHGAGKNAIVLTNRNAAHDRHAVDQVRASADVSLWTDDAKRPDTDFIVQLGPWIDDSGRFDVDRHERRSQEPGVNQPHAVLRKPSSIRPSLSNTFTSSAFSRWPLLWAMK